MAICVTGDTHGIIDVATRKPVLNGRLGESDHLIVLGDFGICWDGGPADMKVRRFWKGRKPTVLFVDGNHENFDLLGGYPKVKWNGGLVRQIDEKIFHLTRGQVFEIEGLRIFAFGGAASRDCGEALNDMADAHANDPGFDYAGAWRNLPENRRKGCRVPGKSWWPAEVPSPGEIGEAKSNLAVVENAVDFILTHAAPPVINAFFFRSFFAPAWEKNLMDFFVLLEENVSFRRWWFGHLHVDRDFDGRHFCLYEETRDIFGRIF